MRNTVTLNGISSSTIQGLLIQELPPISKPMIRTNIEEIDGRDGDIVTKLGYSAYDKEVSIGLYGNFDINQVIAFFNTEGEVIFSNEPDKYYRYKILEQIDFERLIRFRTATVTFHVQPFKYSTTEETIEDSGTETKTGDIVSFISQGNDPLSSHKVNLSPYQNLNGYDHPWVGGAGKNLIPFPYREDRTSAVGVNFVTRPNGTITLNGTSTGSLYYNFGTSGGTGEITLPSGTYTLSGGATEAGHFRIVAVKNGQYFTATGYGGTITFTLEEPSLMYFYGTAPSGQTFNNETFYPQVEKGSTATSWTPYENICPIYPANGKNLLDTESFVAGLVNTTGGITQGGASIVSKDNGIVKFTATGAWEGVASDFFPVYGGYSYCVSNADTVAYYIIGWYDSSKTFISRETQNASAGYKIVTSPSNAKYARVSFQEATAGTWEISKLQFEFGGTHTAYVSYESLGITRTGKNLWSLASGGTATTNYIIPWTSYSVPKGTYTFSFKASIQSAIQPIFRDSTGANVWSQVIYPTALVNGYYKNTITFDRPVTSASIYANGTATLSEIQLEVGSSATQYEPYTAERYYPISDNPVYGGTLDVTTGVLTVTHGYYTENGTANWNRASDGSFFVWLSWASGAIQSNDGYCNYAPYLANITAYSAFVRQTNSTVTLGTKWGDIYPDTTSLKSAFASNPLQLVYPLATPQTYQLTPVQVKTLLGYNNIWTDSGTVEVAIPKLLTVVNEGNYISKPKITVYGTGTVGVYLNGVQAFSIDMDGSDYITIDAEKMEAYQGDILKNRKVTGDYSNFIFNVGENILSVSGYVTNLELRNYSRWL